MEMLTVFLIALVGWSSWKTFGGPSSWPAGSSTKRNMLKSDSSDCVYMAEPTTGPFTYQDERRAFQAGQSLWIQYKNTLGNVNESIVDVYCPGDRNVIFTWCRLMREPRTFARHNIQRWRLLSERYVVDPVIEKYWDEEGILDGSKRVLWTWWLREQLKKGDRYATGNEISVQIEPKGSPARRYPIRPTS
ncbi:MAG: hypothetical protein QM706_08120 [Nitrospira sp.]